jgi:co-chaperonin GroES (HSP10)
MHIGNNRQHLPNIQASNGDLAYFNSDKVQHYEINGKKFIILQQDRILGKEIVE